MFFSEDKISEIIEKNDIIDVISQYMTLKKRGKSFVGLCPFHTEKTPSFNVTVDKQLFYCFGCGVGGNVITFIQKIERMSYVEALRFLAEKAGVVVNENIKEEELKRIKRKETLFEINRESARFFYRNLQRGTPTRDYLFKRGLDNSVIRSFGIGYSMDSWDALKKHMNSKGYSDKLLQEAGLIIERKDGDGFYDRFRNRVIFPIIDLRGRVVAFGGRVMDDSKPKYLNSPDTAVYNKGYNIYGLNLAKNVSKLKNIIVVEGYMDAISLHQFGIKNAVASLGTAFTQQQARLLKRYSNEILICYDADAAGQSATLKGLSILQREGCSVKVMILPRGMDPDDFIRQEGVEAFQDLAESSLSLIEYEIYNARKGMDYNSLQERVVFTRRLAKILSTVDSPVEVDAYIKKYAKEMQISEEAIYAELSKIKNKHIGGNNRHNIIGDVKNKSEVDDGLAMAEKKILNICLQLGKDGKGIFQDIEPGYFTSPLRKKIANVIYLKIKEGKTASAGEILTHLSDEEERQKAAEIFHTEVLETDLKSYGSYIEKIKDFQIDKEIQRLTDKMNNYYKIGDRENSNKVFIEIMDLQKKKK